MVKKNESGLFDKNDFNSKDQSKIIRKKEKKYKCDCCDKRFIQSSHLNDHLKIHSGEKTFKCDYCEKNFTLKCNLNTHLLIHTGEKSFRCEF